MTKLQGGGLDKHTVEQPNPLSIDPSTRDMRGNLFSPFPTLLEARGMTDVGGRLLEGTGEEGGKGYKQLLSQRPKQRRYLSCTHVLSLSRQLKSSAV